MVFEDQRLAPYRGEEPFLFLSYSHRDADRAAEIILRLKEAGFRVWYDEGVIPATQWDENIARAIGRAAYFVSLISEAYLASSNCLDELNYARDLGKPQLLIYLEDVPLPEGLAMRLGRLLAIYRDRYDDPDVFYGRVFRAKGIKVCREALPPPEVEEGEADPDAADDSFLLPDELLSDDSDGEFDAFGGMTGSGGGEGGSGSHTGRIIALLLALMLLITCALGWHYRHQIRSLLSDLRYSHSVSQQSGSAGAGSTVSEIAPDPTPAAQAEGDTAVIVTEETPEPAAETTPEPSTESVTEPSGEAVTEPEATVTPYPVAEETQTGDTVVIDDTGSASDESPSGAGTAETGAADSAASETGAADSSSDNEDEDEDESAEETAA